MISAAIIDDEPPARRDLRRLLGIHSDLRVSFEAGSCADALARFQSQPSPDVVFLDVNLPGESGFELVKHLPNPAPAVIFVTASEGFARRAYDVSGLDYLVKPVEPERLAQAIEKLRRRPRARPKTATPRNVPLRPEDPIFLQTSDRGWLVPVGDIRLLEACGDQTCVHLPEGRPLIARTLRSLEERLPSPEFFRASRSQIVNLRFVQTSEPWFSGSLRLKIADGPWVELSRRQSQVFRDRFGL